MMMAQQKVLVLAITRYGDIIQSTPLLRRLKASGHNVTLVIQSAFAGIAPLLPPVDRIVLFPQDQLAKLLGPGADAVPPLLELNKFLEQVGSCDLLVNLSCSRLSGYLTALIRHQSYSGISYTTRNDRQIRGNWSRYLFNVMLGDNRKANRLNLVDIFTRMGGETPDGSPVELHATQAGEDAAEDLLPRDRSIIGLQLGASESDRCWPATSFALLADRLAECGHAVALLGTDSEKHLAAACLEKTTSRPIDLMGKTDLPTLFSCLRRMSCLVTNDTGTMHFAAAAGTKVLLLATGPAHPHCTGPYISGAAALVPLIPCAPCHYNSDCKSPVCRDAITVDDALHATIALIGDSTTANTPQLPAGLIRSYFCDGYLAWDQHGRTEPLISASQWRDFLDGSLHAGDKLKPMPELVRLTGLLHEGEVCCRRIAALLENRPLPLQQLNDCIHTEEKLQVEIRQLSAIEPSLAPLCDYFLLSREDAIAEDSREMALLAAESYGDLHAWLTRSMP